MGMITRLSHLLLEDCHQICCFRAPEERPLPASGQVGKTMHLGLLGALGQHATLGVSCVIGSSNQSAMILAMFHVPQHFIICTIRTVNNNLDINNR